MLIKQKKKKQKEKWDVMIMNELLVHKYDNVKT